MQHISPYSTMALLGILACLATQWFNSAQAGYPKRTVIEIVLLTFLTICAGAGCAVLGYWQNEGIFKLPFREWFENVGLTAYHGMIGGMLFMALGCKVLKLNIRRICSMTMPALAIFFAFGRVGCTLAGCCYGIPTHFVLFGHLFTKFPTAQLESLFFWLLFIALELFIKKRRIAVTILSYSVFRFCNEFFRGDDRGTLIPGSGLSPAQTIAILLVFVTLSALLFEHIKKKRLTKQADNI